MIELHSARRTVIDDDNWRAEDWLFIKIYANPLATHFLRLMALTFQQIPI